MYESVKSRVKIFDKVRNYFFCNLGVWQGGCLSPFLFSLFLNDIEEQFLHAGLNGLDINMFKIFMLLYDNDIVICSTTAEELQSGLNLLPEYADRRWKMKIMLLKPKFWFSEKVVSCLETCDLFMKVKLWKLLEVSSILVLYLL